MNEALQKILVIVLGFAKTCIIFKDEYIIVFRLQYQIDKDRVKTS